MIEVLIIGLILLVGIISDFFDISDVITILLCTILLSLLIFFINIKVNIKSVYSQINDNFVNESKVIILENSNNIDLLETKIKMLINKISNKTGENINFEVEYNDMSQISKIELKFDTKIFIYSRKYNYEYIFTWDKNVPSVNVHDLLPCSVDNIFCNTF